ncbi:alpha/beta hydrolase [Roseobacter sp. HKCCA0434]|uniref:alpha/beta fold hydrolase n=1 Tax=Roseobacter sp. HKCCA0434 TaxID=3079297 RepID=UPI002905921A|nr:alpha/beta hydrolase [Roseobacter sp. HKCCA0434]
MPRTRISPSWLLLPILALAGIVVVNACSSRPTVGHATVGDWTLALSCAGPRDGGVTVWLEHGIGSRASSSTWIPVFEQVSEFAHVCRYDRPGAGDSPTVPPYGARTYADNMVDLLETVGARDRLIVVGHSFGGYPARILAQEQPTRVQALILVDTVAESLGLRAATGAEAWSEVPAGSEPIDLAAFERAVRPSLAMPVTVLSRGRDLTPAWSRAQRTLLSLHPASHLQIVEGSGHMIPTEAPDAVVTAIREAVARARQGTPAPIPDR